MSAVAATAFFTYLPLWIAFDKWLPPILYYDWPDQIFTLGMPVALLIALYAVALWRRHE